MARRSAAKYACPALERLGRQLLFAPPERRLEQARRAERLHDQIEPDIEYPYEFIAYRITGYRSQEEAETLLHGRRILPDLRLLIDKLSRSVAWPAAADELVESSEELARRLRVSTKTIQRWRATGLRWRWMTDGEAKPRLMFPCAGVERFITQHAQHVDRAVRFTRLTEDQRQQLLARARRIAEAADVSLNQVAAHLARRTGRAAETVRLLLERHDRENPKARIFGKRTGALTIRQKRAIARAHRMGVSVAKMVRHFHRTRASIYRVIRERRAFALRQATIEMVVSPTFGRPDADEVLLRPEAADIAGEERTFGAPGSTEDLPAPLRPFFEQSWMEPQRQISLLVRYNYLKYKADQLRSRLDRFNPRANQLGQIEGYLAQAAVVADRVLLANTPLLLSVARRHLIGQSDRSQAHQLALLEQGQEVLARCVETYDASHGQTFEAYFIWSLMRRFATRRTEEHPKAHRRDQAPMIHPRLKKAMERKG